MPLEARISCLSPALREAFTDQLDHVEDDTVKEIAVSLLEALADCPDGIPIGLTFHEVEEEQAKARRQRGKARPGMQPPLVAGRRESRHRDGRGSKKWPAYLRLRRH